MKVSYSEIMTATQAIKSLCQNGSMPVSLTVAFQFAQVAKILSRNVDEFEKARLELVDIFVPKPDEFGRKVVPQNRRIEFERGLDKMMREEIEIDVQQFRISDFGNQQVPLTMFVGMEWLIEC